MSKAILCDGDWTLTASGWDCTGAITQVVYSVPAEVTAATITEGIFYGFSATLPLMAVAWGGRQLLKMLR
ncbi:hypothetical protein SAMN04487881_3692 [Marinobacter sp. es.048]|uniref:hypothetical protein n=1 Tax=Marinobacter sp. es.048 TaxID=1761795 RepID=UPI000B58D7E9|nr:hypothetical protein [Marinobacter sp. es.048]SNC76944.1 hypothetical protein SAMN04487881_3692 [Marinobacter sp. es.048]